MRVLGNRQLLPWRKRSTDLEDASRRALLSFVVPLWIGAGLADWWCHRRSDIEHTAGTREAAIHAAMMTEAGVPSLLGLLFEVNAGILATAYGLLAAHQATAILDVEYAESQREVTTAEQHIHGLLEQTPVMACTFLTVLHWDQALALIGLGKAEPRFRLERKRRPLPSSQILGMLGSILCFGVLPYTEEIIRCRRAARLGRSADMRPFATDGFERSAEVAAVQ